MTRSKMLIVIISIIALLGIACTASFFWGFQRGISASRFASMGLEVAEFSLASQHLSAQMENADCEGVKEALNDFLGLLERWKNVEAGLIVSPRSYLADKALAHTRLARVEEHQGNGREAEKHIQAAIEACKELKWKDCSIEKLISITRNGERLSPIACIAGSE